MTDATPLTDAEITAWKQLGAPDHRCSYEAWMDFFNRALATITSLQSDLQRTRDALEKAYPLCIGWSTHWKGYHGNFAPEHLETLDDCAKALGLDILPSKTLNPLTGT